MQYRFVFALWICASCMVWAGSHKDPRFGFRIEPPQIVRPVGEATARVVLSTKVDGVQGWSFGIISEDSTDGSVKVRIVRAEMGPDLLIAGPHGGEPSFHSCTLYPDKVSCDQYCADCTGVVQGVVLDYEQEVFLNKTDHFSTLVLTISIEGEPGGGPAKLSFTSELGDPKVATVVVLNGRSFEPALQLGSEVYLVECERNFRAHIGDVQGVVGSERKVPVYLDFNYEGTAGYTVQGWSLGVRHNSSVLQLLDVTTDGTDTATAQDGSPPDFSQFKFEPLPPPNATEGFTHGVVVDYDVAVTLPPVNDFLDCYAIYRLVGQPACPQALETQVRAVGDLGDPVIRLVMVTEGESRTACQSDPGTVSIICAQPFVRGDSNSDNRVDLADAVYVLQYLFRQGPAPLCADAADANDDGSVDSSDAIYLVNFQFLEGPQPPPPYPGPGLDPTEDSLPDC